MGLCSSNALGMALSIPDKVISLDGDGSLLMNMGTIATIGQEQPKNLIVVVWDNEEWGQTGHQTSHTGRGTDLEQVAKACNIPHTASVNTLEDLDQVFQEAMKNDGPWFIVAKIEEEEYLPLSPNEPEMTLYRFRTSFVGQELPSH
jgi:sulfopyruvate decarboxylase subunit beta